MNGLVGAELGGANVVEGTQSVQVVNVALTCILGQGHVTARISDLRGDLLT